MISGLNDQEVTDSRREHGWNLLTPPKRESLWKLYLDKYKDPIIKILLAAALVSLVLAVIENEYIETIGIFFAIILATTVGFLFEMDAARKFDVLTRLNEEQQVKVIRNGRVCLVARKDIVVGDTVLVETGDEIPADGVLDSSNSLQIDESMLTGEPIATKSAVVPVGKGDGESAYAANYVLRSSMVMNGKGRFVVTAVGNGTEIGKVARSSGEQSGVKTPLNLQLDRLGKVINRLGVSFSILSAVLFLGHDVLVNPLWEAFGSAGADYVAMSRVVLKYFMMAVTLIVMAVPEGLPMAVTLSLALNMRRMLRSNNLVRKLHACETMGAVTVICTDKTGTLTENRMTVQECSVPVSGATEVDDGVVQEIYKGISVNTTANLDGDKGIGNPTEVALLLWLRDRGADYLSLRRGMEIVGQQPFSTETKQMSTTVRDAGGKVHTYIKGAPEIILAQCDLAPDALAEIRKTLAGYQKKAMRTLAMALDGRLQAVFGISDPVRSDVPEAVRRCHDAGIEVKIVTGDVDATALEIARRIGLVDGAGNAVRPGAASTSALSGRLSISGAEFAALSDDEAGEVARNLCVMSRARPQDKQRLVQLLQKQGQVVAVTGDGTNDAPALNHAHVGLSLGSGTNVAKEASDMTLLDDSFGSIANAVMWGRSLYRNIQRFLFFQLVVNVAALLLVIAGSLVGTEMPLTVTQILWVNIIMDTFAALALSSLPPSCEVMAEKPRCQTDFILSMPIIRGIVVTGLLMFAVMFAYLIYCEYGFDFFGGDTNHAGVDPHELTRFFTVFVMLQWWNLFNARCIGSRHSAFRRLWASRSFCLVLLVILAGQWLMVSYGGAMFRCVPLSVSDWIWIFVLTSPVLWAGEIYRRAKGDLPHAER
ncbi:MAG: calcium-translocating P-type ATPase, PMCA-type [Bacteroidales bacterium]|nr:calcium-translocating P-type ATPase, PMCA-type [Bacteroidales bacterium]MCM1146831.1 calcium-translocating P-type ATPase, PMCA-type [Bacteroidales bacterium]MCM1205671.1 calcium-translocating P-type ATPase, PMCA-type [Bacillota bacterium]MCM1510217.1 calcium-translocating P-type ATPase, PMCA-type [Clostridium sp.]